MSPKNELTWQATAAANILAARNRRGRLTGRKSRAGCITCKGRRVKCDQARPNCQRCTTSGRTCQGYIDLPSRKLDKTSNFLIGLNLSQTLGLDSSERRIFDYFLSWTSRRLAGNLDRHFWCGRLLQVAHAEPIVRDALLAISLLYEHPQFLISFHNRTLASAHEDLMPGTWLQSDSRSDSSSDSGSSAPLPTVARPRVDRYHALALKYYNRSMYGVMERVNSGTATPLLALLTCVLFICIETMRDNAFSALALFKKGAALARSLDFNDYTQAEHGLLVDVRNRMARLSVMAAISGHSEPLDSSDRPYECDLHSFRSLSDARNALFQIMFQGQAFIRDAEYRADLKPKHTCTGSPNDSEGWSFSTEMTCGKTSLPVPINEEPDDGVTRLFYGCQDAATEAPLTTPPDSVHPTFLPHVSTALLERQREHLSRLHDWYAAFEALKVEDSEAARSLLMHYHVYSIWITRRLDPWETGYDKNVTDFKKILCLAEAYIQHKPERQTYTPESEVVVPLYFVAVKCRIPSLRRRAIALINKATKKECTFGASSSAEIAARLIAVEEEGLFPKDNGILSHSFDDAVLPPDSSRIRGFEIIVNRPAGRHELRVTRYRRREDGCWIKSISDFPI